MRPPWPWPSSQTNNLAAGLPVTVFTAYTYQHTDRVTRSRPRVWFVLASIALALAVAAVGEAVVGAALLLVPLIAWAAAPRQLLVGPRYLLCGDSIVYFGNVKRMTLSPSHGKLRLECTNGTAFVLERRRLSRGVRAVEKLRPRKATRFDTLSAKIIAQVRAASANAVLISA